MNPCVSVLCVCVWVWVFWSKEGEEEEGGSGSRTRYAFVVARTCPILRVGESHNCWATTVEYHVKLRKLRCHRARRPRARGQPPASPPPTTSPRVATAAPLQFLLSAVAFVLICVACTIARMLFAASTLVIFFAPLLPRPVPRDQGEMHRACRLPHTPDDDGREREYIVGAGW